MKTFSEIVKNLFKIKSLFSLCAMGLLIYCTITDKLTSEVISGLLCTIVYSYFNKKDGE